MHTIVRDKLDEIRDICVRHGVKSLSVFGSVLDTRFDPARSDIDFIVEFIDADLGPWMRRLVALQTELESLLHHRCDVVPANMLRGPYFAAAVERTRVPVYAAA